MVTILTAMPFSPKVFSNFLKIWLNFALKGTGVAIFDVFGGSIFHDAQGRLRGSLTLKLLAQIFEGLATVQAGQRGELQASEGV